MRSAALLILLFLILPVSAATNYHQDTDRQKNDPLNPEVHQGDTIYLGKTYDLSFVTGVSNEYAYWTNWKVENTDCSPTKRVDIRYFQTFINKTSVTLNLNQWTAGDWYYWDSYECGMEYYDYETGQTLTRDRPFDHENKLAFHVIRPRSIPLQTIQIASIVPIKGYQTAY